ncbi:transposase family Tnp2 protein, partial [Rhizoctonia solani AG-3 Rhs1AP]
MAVTISDSFGTLGLSTDGVGPFKTQKQQCWPLILINYSLPPSIRTHLENILCLSVIPGPQSPKELNTFLEPLIDELEELACGISAFNSTNQRLFMLHAYLIAAFGDMPAAAKLMNMKGPNGPILLRGRFRQDCYYKHFIKLVRLINLCMDFEITHAQVIEIRQGFAKWVEDYENWVYQHYFQRTTGLASILIGQHEEATLAIWSLESAVDSVAISPDGNRIASGNHDGSLCVYDIHTGAVVAGPFQGHTESIWSVAFSPDGRRIASGSADKTVIVWDADTGRIVTGPLHKHVNSVWSVAFSPNGKCLVSGSNDMTIIVWDTYTGAIAFGPLKGHSKEIYSVAFSPDGQLIASGSDDKTIRLWDASTGAAVADPLRGHISYVGMVAFSPDGSKLASSLDEQNNMKITMNFFMLFFMLTKSDGSI